MGSPAQVPWDLTLGTVQAREDSTLAVNVAGVQLDPLWLGAYIPTAGDSVVVIVRAGSAYVLGHAHVGARPLTGTITGAALEGLVPVTTATGALRCRYVGTPPSTGSLVRLDWAGATPWIWPLAAAASSEAESDGSGSAPPPPPPPPPRTGENEFAAVESSTYGTASGWRRYGDSVRQWRYSSEAPSTGAWFYGSRPTALRGKTITRARVYVPARVRVGSYNAPLAINLYRHTSGTRPSGDVTRVAGPHSVTIAPIDQWSGGWLEVPAAWGQSIVDGGGGIGISGAPYLGVVGISNDPRSGALSLAWTT
ncbi:MAG: hypothetical protein J0H73_06360 [Salana multivorans]|uniref:hypothetical protein n=1 Tax=Salana multivorans TaxID=120377 RepID=UPI00095B687D|nr:hypothetical protein [Salana multivorans]MBN8881923.1 hypothetical protein [Salana multivorans]OJX93938.1 MAG: hypothetical protein BGO96_00280 [Micrococcales bacterium 73-15]